MLSRKKLTQIFLRKQDRHSEQQPTNSSDNSIKTFDESSLQLQFNDPVYHTDTITINAYLKATSQLKLMNKHKQKINLRCKWYVKSNSDFQLIQGYQLDHYKPCLDDIGCTICVQAEPYCKGKQYSGITLMHQTNPIKLNPKVAEQLTETLLKIEYSLISRLMNVNDQSIIAPQNVMVVLGIQDVHIYNQEGLSLFTGKLDNNEVQVQLMRQYQDQIWVKGINSQYYMKLANREECNMLAMLIRTRSQQNSYKIPLKQNKLQLQQVVNQHQTRFIYNNQINSLRQQLTIIQQQKYLQVGNYTKRIQELQNQNRFYGVELSLIKKQQRELQKQYRELHRQHQQIQHNLQIREQNLKSQIDQPKQMIKTLQMQLSHHKCSKQLLQEQNEQLKKTIQSYENQVINLKKKVTSLANEKILSLSKHNKLQPNLEVQTLKMQIKNMQMLLKHHLRNHNNNEESNLIIIINKMTETLTEKQQQLQSMRNINRNLMQQSKEL